MKITIISLLILATLAGCYSPNPGPTKMYQPTPEVQAKIDEKISQRTEIALDKIIDAKVAASVEKALPKAVADGIGQWFLDTGPYGAGGLLAILLGKYWVDLRQERKKNIKSDHQRAT